MFYTEICSDEVHIGLGTFETAHETARAYDAAVWRLSRPRLQMNCNDARICQHAHDLAPPSRLVTDEDRQEHPRWQRRLLIAEADEQAMAEWRRRYRGTSPMRTHSRRRGGQIDVRNEQTGAGRSQYLAELLAEHEKLGPFMQVLPICSKLLVHGEIS
ncbi:Glutathione S-transferase DHAR2 [Hordeum vulgare]|nr:Glutathione S-transferase DHAR2 [Hordeum vulgare]